MFLSYRNSDQLSENDQRDLFNEIENTSNPELIIENETIDRDIYLQSLALLKQEISPLELLKENYPENLPIFDYYFLKKLIKFYMKQCPGSDELIREVVFSNQVNAEKIVIYMDSLILNAPFSFDLLLCLFQTNSQSIERFIGQGGIFLMAVHSDKEEFHSIISEMLYSMCNYDYKNDFILLDSSVLVPPNNFEEFDITFEMFFDNLLASSVENVWQRTIDALSILFKNNPNNFNIIQPYFVDKFSSLLLEDISFYPYILNASLNVEDSDLTSVLFPVCFSVFFDKMDISYSPAIKFLEKHIDEIMPNKEYCQELIPNLFQSIDDSQFESSIQILKFLLYFCSKCPIEFLGAILQMGMISNLCDILHTFNNSELEMEYQDLIEFFIIHTSFILQRIIDNDYSEDISGDLNNLEESLQNFQDHKYEKIRDEVEHSLQLIKKMHGNESE